MALDSPATECNASQVRYQFDINDATYRGFIYLLSSPLQSLQMVGTGLDQASFSTAE